MVVLSIPPSDDDTRTQAERFAARLNAASELSITRSKLLGLEHEAGFYRFYLFEDGEWKEPQGLPLSNGNFDGTIAVEFTVEQSVKRNEPAEKPRREQKKKPAPQILFSPTGETTPFSATFTSRNAAFIVGLDHVGTVTVSRRNG